MTEAEVANLIRSFLDGSCGKWEWDDFVSAPKGDRQIESLRQNILNLQLAYPSDKPNQWSSKEGLEALSSLAQSISLGT